MQHDSNSSRKRPRKQAYLHMTEDQFQMFGRFKINGSAIKVFLALKMRAGDRGTCFPSRADIAMLTGLQERAVTRAIRDLEKAGLLETERGVGRGNRSDYVLNPVFVDPSARSEKAAQARPFEVRRKGDKPVTFSDSKKGDIGGQKGDKSGQEKVTNRVVKGDNVVTRKSSRKQQVENNIINHQGNDHDDDVFQERNEGLMEPPNGRAGSTKKRRFPHLQESHLQDPDRMLELWREFGEPVYKINEVDFFAMAYRARKLGDNPCGLFRKMVTERLTSHISIDDENAARETLRHLAGDFRREERAANPDAPIAPPAHVSEVVAKVADKLGLAPVLEPSKPPASQPGKRFTTVPEQRARVLDSDEIVRFNHDPEFRAYCESQDPNKVQPPPVSPEQIQEWKDEDQRRREDYLRRNWDRYPDKHHRYPHLAPTKPTTPLEDGPPFRTVQERLEIEKQLNQQKEFPDGTRDNQTVRTKHPANDQDKNLSPPKSA